MNIPRPNLKVTVTSVITVVLVGTGQIFAAGNAAAAPSYGAEQRIVSGCVGDSPYSEWPIGEAAASADGTIRGFAGCSIGSLAGNKIRYFSRTRAGSIQSLATPYVGYVLSVAWDGLGTLFVVYEQVQNSGNTYALYIGKEYVSNGKITFSTPGKITSTLSYDASPPASVTAYHGRWGVVWTDQSGRLYERQDLYGSLETTLFSAGHGDSDPAIATDGSTVSIVFERAINGPGPGSAELLIKRHTSAGIQPTYLVSSAPLDSGRGQAFAAVVQSGHTYVAFNGFYPYGNAYASGGTYYADDTSGHFATVNLTGKVGSDVNEPLLAVSGANVFVARGEVDLEVAERTGGVWASTTLPGDHGPLSVISQPSGKSAVVIYDGVGDHINVAYQS